MSTTSPTPEPDPAGRVRELEGMVQRLREQVESVHRRLLLLAKVYPQIFNPPSGGPAIPRTSDFTVELNCNLQDPHLHELVIVEEHDETVVLAGPVAVSFPTTSNPGEGTFPTGVMGGLPAHHDCMVVCRRVGGPVPHYFPDRVGITTGA